MKNLIKQEQFELEILDKLNSNKFLSALVFGGGTMLRLCFGLNRFSVDLDFWLMKDTDTKILFDGIKECFASDYVLKDSANKFYTLLFELKSKDYPNSLKIEIRKETKKIKTEQAIAYSPHASIQVLLNVVSLRDMMKSKIETFLDRREIRDLFDIEFLLKKGILLDASSAELKKVLKGIEALVKNDYLVKLGSLLQEDQRKYYAKENFKILKAAIEERLKMDERNKWK